MPKLYFLDTPGQGRQAIDENKAKELLFASTHRTTINTPMMCVLRNIRQRDHTPVGDRMHFKGRKCGSHFYA